MIKRIFSILCAAALLCLTLNSAAPRLSCLEAIQRCAGAADNDTIERAALNYDTLCGVCAICRGIQDGSLSVRHTRDDWKTAVAPTCTHTGLTEQRCADCGKQLYRKTLPALGHQLENGKCSRCGLDTEALDSLPFTGNAAGYTLYETNPTTLQGGGYNLAYGVMGYRVRCVQKTLQESHRKYGWYDNTTVASVKRFQKKNNLPITGEVDLDTWRALGYTEQQWTEWDTYVHPSEYQSGMTRPEIIEKFLEIAYTYLGAEYIFGCAGSPEQGGDRSGLVLSCLYGIGVNPTDYDSMQHNFNEYNSRLMWTDAHFQTVSFSDRQRGDLIFYKDANDVIIHVAIYLGDNLCIESCRQTVEVMSLYKASMRIAGVRRVLYY